MLGGTAEGEDETVPERLHVEDWPAAAGTPGLVQGSYGAAGNLELVVPAVDDGLWVGWFNADPEDARAGAARLRWSGALRFGRGRRYRAATIAQVVAGDRALEVLALADDGSLVRHVWTAEVGFADHGVVRGSVRAASRVCVLPDGGHAAVVADSDGSVHLLEGAVTEHLDWRPDVRPWPGAASWVDAAPHLAHLDVLRVFDGSAYLDCAVDGTAAVGTASTAQLAVDGDDRRWVLRCRDAGGRLGSVGGPAVDLLAGPAALTASTIDGVAGLDLVVRRGTGLQHLRLTEAGLGQPQPVRAEVWVEAWDEESATGTVHRGV